MNAQPGQPNQNQPNPAQPFQGQPFQGQPFQENLYQAYPQPAPPYAGPQFSALSAGPGYAGSGYAGPGYAESGYAGPGYAAPAYGPHGYQCPPAPVNDQAGGRARTVIAAVVAAVALGVGGGALLFTHVGNPKSRTISPVAQVSLEPTASSGPSPFMTPVGTDTSGLTSPAGTAGTFAGDTAGLLAQSGEKPSCDAKTLVGNLTTDPAKNAAWAGALHIETADVPTFVGTLTPMVLRSDTAVTSYGYDNGSFSPYPAVLQAGTAVFVNSFGEPTVKCFSGNPLTRAQSYTGASYVGPHWGRFAPTAVTYIRPTPTVIENYTYVDADHGGFREHHSWCWEHRDSDHCHHNPDPEPRHDKDGEQKPKVDPALDAAAKIAADKAESDAKDAKSADATATSLEQQANQAKINATLFLEPQRSIEVAKADQLGQAAQAARAAATAKATAAKTSADDAQDAKNTAAKAAGVTPDADDEKLGGAQKLQPLAGDPAGIADTNAVDNHSVKAGDKTATAPAQLLTTPGTKSQSDTQADTKSQADAKSDTEANTETVVAVPAAGATETGGAAAGTTVGDKPGQVDQKSTPAETTKAGGAETTTARVQDPAPSAHTEQVPAQPETTTKSGTTTEEAGTTEAQADDN